MKQFRFLTSIMCLALLLSMSAGAMDAPPGGFGGGNVPPPPPGGGSMTFYTGDAVTDLESGDYTGETFPDSVGEGEVALRVGPGITASLTDSSITKTAGDLGGDDSSFYGVNSGILAYSEDASTPASLTMEGGSVTTSSQGANGIFAYGDSTISLRDVTVTTEGSGGAGGIMVAGGGTLHAENCTVTTEGGSSAAIRSDRGSGVMTIDGGTYIANGSLGTGSPAIYCVADITVSNASMQAGNAQAMCFEGRNPAKIYNCYLEGNYTASDDDENSNIMVYQSMSGDSEEGTTFCTMVGGLLKANNESPNGNAKMFYTTNTYCYISLAHVTMDYSDTMETFLLCACNTNARGWGVAGANGSECVLYCVDQDVEKNIIYDTWSYLGCFFTKGSTVNSAILCREDNGDRGCDVFMDSSSVWTVTGDSVVRDLYTGGASIENASIVDAGGNLLAGEGEYTVTVLGTYSEEDHSDFSFVPGIGTVGDGEYTFDTEPDTVDPEYIPTAPDGTAYPEAAFLSAETPDEEAESAGSDPVEAESTASDSVQPEESSSSAPASETESEPDTEAESSTEPPVDNASASETESSTGAQSSGSSHAGWIAAAVIIVIAAAAGVIIFLRRKKR